MVFEIILQGQILVVLEHEINILVYKEINQTNHYKTGQITNKDNNNT